MKKLNFILSVFILAFFAFSCSSDDDSGNPDPGGGETYGSFSYSIDGVGSYTSTAEDDVYVIYSTDPEETEYDGVTGVYIISGSSADANNNMNVFLYEVNGEIITSINEEEEYPSGAYVSHSENSTYFSISGQIEVLHASHGPLNGSNFANAEVKIKFNGQFMNYNEELPRTINGSISANTPPLYYPGL